MQVTDLADRSRIWIYQADRLMSEHEVNEITRLGQNFILEWSAHGAALKSVCEVRYGYFLMLTVDDNQAMASGCSIDASMHFVKGLEKKFQIDFFNRTNVAYKSGGVIKLLKMSEFEDALQAGTLASNTIVFNNLVSTVGEFKSNWEVAVSHSWHAQLLPA